MHVACILLVALGHWPRMTKKQVETQTFRYITLGGGGYMGLYALWLEH